MANCPAAIQSLRRIQRSSVWRPTSPGNEDVLICINAPYMTQRVLKSWWQWTYQNSAVKRAAARAIPEWVTSWEVWYGEPKADNIVSLGVGRYKVHSSEWRGYTVRTPFSVWQALGFLPQDTVWSCPNDVLHKASCAHQFNRLDITLQGPDAQSLIMVITCSWSATFRTLGQHRPDAALLWKLSALFSKGSCSWPSGRSVKPFGHPWVFWS
jgi:hypothetical protein